MSSIENLKENVKHVPISFFSRLFNIGSAQWPRVTECWVITLFFKIGSAIGWTILTASFVGQFGILWLPALFVINAALTILSTFFFEKLIMRVKREVLMIVMLICASLSLFFASFMYDKSVLGFFGLIIFAESVFLSQFYVFLPILVGDRFTPLESQRTFPFIESAESIGGILGGLLVGFLAEKLPITAFLYVWIICLICIIFAFVITSSVRMSLPPLPFRVKTNMNREQSSMNMDQIKLVLHSIKKMSFVKGLVVIVLVQWVFMNLLEFQFTKAVEQSVTSQQEETLAKAPTNLPEHTDSKMFQAAILSSPDSAKTVSTINPDADVRALTHDEQAALTKKLGELKGLFSASALIVQMIFASRLITGLGVVGALLLHPIIMLMSLVGMFLKFGFTSSALTKLSFEITNIVHKNAYFTSQYAIPKFIRDQAAEFLEGIVRPMGTMVSMLLILGLQMIFGGRDLTTIIQVSMFVTMVIILFTTLRLRPRYTDISKNQLFEVDMPYSEQVNAIEVLEQKGHINATEIFVKKLSELQEEDSNESRVVRMRLISALGQLKDYGTLPDIFDSLSDSDPDIRLEAAQALMNFKDIGTHFYSQAFSRYRMIELLKDVFRKEQSGAVRNAIIRVFSLLKEPAIVAFLLDVLKDSSAEVRADCIYTLGLFHDPNTAYYILPFMDDANAFVRANAAIALWQFSKYRSGLEEDLNEMLQSLDRDTLRAGLFALGEINLRANALFECLNSEDSLIRLEAAIALLKCNDARGFGEIIVHILETTPTEFEKLRRTLARLKPESVQLLENLLVHFIPHYLRELANRFDGKSLEDMDPVTLENLRRLYMIVGQHEELFAIERALKASFKPSVV